MTDIAKNIHEIKDLISIYEQKYQRPYGCVRLLAASKYQSLEKMTAAIHAGQFIFGENYLQEALKKMQALAEYPLEWHFIGPIQSNKTRKIAEHFAWVLSLDNIKIAERLHAQRPEHLPPLNVCIQVKVSDEARKSGVDATAVYALAQHCQTLSRLRLRGLMAIPAAHADFAEQRCEFQKLNTLYQSLCKQGFSLDTLSMGMSADFEAAIAEGATLVRIGTAIFGKRSRER